jgi:hypothetical protein
MKKAIALLLLTVFLLPALSAFEIEGSVSSSTAGKTASIKTINIHELTYASLGLTLPLDFNKNTNLKISGDFSAAWQINQADAILTADCTELTLKMAIPLGEDSYGSFEMGRFAVEDCTGLILKQNLDGVRFLVDAPSFKGHLYGGYTGLLNARHNPMLPVTTVPSGIYPLAPTFITADLYTYMPDVYEDKSIGIELLGAFNSASPEATKLYAMARIDGKFLYFIPYTLCTAMVWTNENRTFGHMANLSFASMEYTVNSTHFGGKVLHASGNTQNFANFKQLSIIHADIAGTMLYENLIKMGFFIDNTGANGVKISTEVFTFLTLADTTRDIIFKGIQWDFNIDVPFTQKSKLAFDVNQYIPIKGGTFNTTLEMYLSFGF